MATELLNSMARANATHVPYKGSTLAHPDLISGRTSLMFDTVAAANVQIKAGRLRALAVTTARRSSVLPDVPTMQEAGIAGYETSTWGGLLAPAGTPASSISCWRARAARGQDSACLSRIVLPSTRLGAAKRATW